VIGSLADHLLALPAWVALVVVFALPALESSAFVGFVFPGEVALILGGVLAYQGRVALPAVLAAGVLGAVVGDTVGYLVGRRFGRRMLDGTLGRFVRKDHLDRAEHYLAERGGRAVFLGRFTAALRVLIPGLAGMSGVRYRVFLVYNVAGGVVWATTAVLLGYLGGSSWKHVEHVASRVGLAALGVVVLTTLVVVLLRRVRGAPLERLTRRLQRSRPVVAVRHRFPRGTAWAGHRLDPGRPTGLPLTLATAVAVGAGWTFVGITQDVLAHEELALVDPQVHAWVLTHRTGALTAFFRVATWLGSSAVLVPVLAVSALLLARRARSWRPAATIAVVYGAAVLLHAVVAVLVHRDRPPQVDWLAPAVGWSYPSGHTTQAVAGWGVLALLLGARAVGRLRTAATSAALLVAAVVAASRVYLGVHWLTDVLGAAAMATTVLALWTVVRLTLSPASGSAEDGGGDDRHQPEDDEPGEDEPEDHHQVDVLGVVALPQRKPHQTPPGGRVPRAERGHSRSPGSRMRPHRPAT
jgi:undecaprenyl-diphosphatase